MIANYPALAAGIYCGNANNATASWGYKATTNVSPSSNRSTSGTYIVLPDVRGEFLRGWDDGRGIDSGRTLWSYQTDGAPNITGSAGTRSIAGPFGLAFSGSGAITTTIGGGASTTQVTASSTVAGSSISFSATDSNAKYGAASEIRPRNAAGLACIWYQ